MVTKNQIDLYFTKNYSNINALAKNIINQYNRNYESESLLNNGYIYLTSKMDEIPGIEDIQKWLITYIKNEIRWTNSQIGKEESIKYSEELTEKYDNIDEDDDIDDKVAAEMRYNEQKTILHQYRHEYLDDKLKQIIFDVYFIKGHSSSRKMAAHFGHRSHKNSWELIRDMKLDINYFIENVYNKENNNNIK